MSPLSLRRYRAERLLQRDFNALRGRVITAVRARLRAHGVALDDHDLEACYAQAWQGLYGETLAGREIADPFAWLVLVSFRRAIEEHRARCSGAALAERLARERERGREVREPDLAAELDDRRRLRLVLEGIGARLSGREREAAALCYLQGFSRAQAAARMGLSEARMRKLMEGRGRGRPGVAAKVGELVETIRDGDWCEQQGSLMRGFAYGLLDPAGERYRLALMHSEDCPSCRAYVASLRGLAAVLPPPLLPCAAVVGALARLLDGARAGAGAGRGQLAGAGAQSGGGVAGTLPASAAAGSGGALGGGWLLGGAPLVGKLAVGCVIALGVGAGCVALDHDGRDRRHARAHAAAPVAGARAPRDPQTGIGAAGNAAPALAAEQRAPAPRPLSAPVRVAREFGPERGSPEPGSPASSGQTQGQAAAGVERAHVASLRPRAGSATQLPASTSSEGGGAAGAAREFSPG